MTEFDYFSTQTGKVKDPAGHSHEHPYAVGEGVSEGFYTYVWPNFTLNIYPGPGNVSLNLFLPLGVDRTLAVYDYCFTDGIPDEQVRDFVRFIDQVQEEDIVLCELVQRGMLSGYFERGQLMLSREHALQHFQRLVCRSVGAEDTASDVARAMV